MASAVWKTTWNGWTTARRFQRRGEQCVLCGSSAVGGDSIEHMARCRVTRELSSYVNIPISHYSHWLGNFVILGVNHGSVEDSLLVKRAVVVYAIYRTSNKLRHSPARSNEEARDMAQQYTKEAVRGHVNATAMLESFCLGASL